MDLKVGICNRICTACKSREGPMFKYPRDERRREIWRTFFGLDTISKSAQFCFGHFRREDVKEVGGLHRLSKLAEPYIKIPESVASTPKPTTIRARIPRCIVAGCRKTAQDDTSLHRFPRLLERREQWATILKVQRVPTRHTLICSDHFLPDDFHTLDGQKSLKCSATPSLNLQAPANASDDPDPVDLDAPGDDSSSASNDRHGSPNNDAAGSSPGIENVDCEIESPLEGAGGDSCDENGGSLSDSSGHSCVHDNISLDDDEGHRSLNEVLSSSDSENLASMSSIFENLSLRLTEDIANVVNDTSNSKGHEENRALPLVDEVDGGTQTDPRMFNIFDLLQNDTQLKAFTGVNFVTFNCLVELVLELCDEEDNDTIPMKNKKFLTLCKLRLHLSYECLSVLVGIDRRKCGTIFASTIHLLAVVLQHTLYWPTKEEIKLNMPECFKKFSDTVVVLDCSEVPVMCPNCLKCKIRTYSHYKGGQTVKILMGVAPSGLITFLSKVYGGRASDKQIFEESPLCTDNLLEPFIDAVMVDKGFRIDSACAERNIKIYRPPFVIKKQPLSEAAAKSNAEIANARVHVERVFQRMKIFAILQGKLSWAMVPYLDEIFTVIAGLVNLSAPVLADNKFMTYAKV